MILGMPCIATFAGGTSSLLIDNTSGILIQDGDPWSLAGAIIELQNNPKKAIRLGNNAKLQADLRHDSNKILHDLRNIYYSVSK